MAERTRRLEVWGEASNRATQFGSITLEGVVYDHDVLVRPDSTVKRRKKKLSKAVYGTSHTISLAEAKYVYGQGEGAERLIIGAGSTGGSSSLLRRPSTSHASGARSCCFPRPR